MVINAKICVYFVQINTGFITHLLLLFRLLGPSQGRVLGDVPKLVDEIYIQFYNNWCHTGNKPVFYDHVKKWVDYSNKTDGPMIFVGVPANKRASGNEQHYRPPNELAEIYKVNIY